MTMSRLAKMCNVSVSTVSKAFSDAEDIGEETKALIFKTAKAEGCFGKFYKGKYQKKIIAVLCPELQGGYYMGVVEVLKNLIEKDNGICLISTYDFSETKQKELIEYYASFLRVDGIIVFSLKAKLKKGYDTPIVSLFSSKDPMVDTVKSDILLAVEELVRILYEKNHRKIAFIGENLTKVKEKYFEDYMKKHPDSEYLTVRSDKRFEEAGMEGVEKLVNSNFEFTAVVCAYDLIAFGAIKELKNRGIKVPNDVSVVGMDNLSVGGFAETSLSTVDVTPNEICSAAYELLSKKIKNRYFHANRDITIKPRIIIRESVDEAK